MSVFLKFENRDFVYTKYKTHPIYDISLEFVSPHYEGLSFFRIESDENFEQGIERSVSNTDGSYTHTDFNLSGTISVIPNAALTNMEKVTVGRLRDIYTEKYLAKSRNFTSSSVWNQENPISQNMDVVNIPSVLYGTEIKPHSFSVNFDGYTPEPNQSGSRASLYDDGYGGIISSSYEGVDPETFDPIWKRLLVGSIFYSHGVVMIGHEVAGADWGSAMVSFSGTNTTPMMMYVCQAPRGYFNFSRNKSFTVHNTSSNQNEITTKTNKTYITTVSVYDENYELLGVAKTSKPILNEEDAAIQFRLKINY